MQWRISIERLELTAEHDIDIEVLLERWSSQTSTLIVRRFNRRICYQVRYCAMASTARVSVLLGCRSSSRIVK